MLTPSWAQEITTRGFIALDLFSFEKAESQRAEHETGIGTLDLKLYAQKDDLSAKIKLDLDGDLSDRHSIFEETLVFYRLSPDWNITFGKGKVPFHQMHWGVIVNSYVDGGSVLGAENSIRDFDEQILLSIRYGQFSRGFFNHFTIFGDPQQVRRNSEADPCFEPSCSSSGSSFEVQDLRSFSLEYQRGISNQFEYFITREIEASFSLLWFKRDLDPNDNYGAALALRYRRPDFELWSELTSGQFSKSQYLRFSAKRQVEHWFQIGMEKRLSEKNSILMNVEGQWIDKETQKVAGSSRQTGINEKYFTKKIELGTKHYLSRSAFITLGILLEHKNFDVTSKMRTEYISTTGQTINSEQVGAGAKATLAYWF
jgi:hypothetical protein